MAGGRGKAVVFSNHHPSPETRQNPGGDSAITTTAGAVNPAVLQQAVNHCGAAETGKSAKPVHLRPGTLGRGAMLLRSVQCQKW
jgi:hypothetical protein